MQYNTMKHVISILLAVAILTVSGMLSSCVKEVTLDAGDRTVVVECLLSNEPGQELSLSFSKGASETSAMELTEAVATLIDLTDNKTVGEFRRDADGKWRMDYAAIPLHKYRLEVKVPGYDLIYAEDTMPIEVPLAESHTSIFAMFDLYSWYENYFGLEDWGTESRTSPFWKPEGTYEHDFCSFFRLREDLGQEKYYGQHLWVYGMRWNDATHDYELADKICFHDYSPIDGNKADDFNLTGEVYEAPVAYSSYPYSYKGTEYLTYLTLYHQFNGCPFHKNYLRLSVDLDRLTALDIWANIYDTDAAEDNMRTAATAEHSLSPRTTRLKSLHHYITDLDGVVMDKYLLNDKQEYDPIHSDGYLQFVLVSDTYDKYIEDALFQMRRQGNVSGDLSELSIFMRENTYSNINGGAGIFATSTRMKGRLGIVPSALVDFSKPIK